MKKIFLVTLISSSLTYAATTRGPSFAQIVEECKNITTPWLTEVCEKAKVKEQNKEAKRIESLNKRIEKIMVQKKALEQGKK